MRRRGREAASAEVFGQPKAKVNSGHSATQLSRGLNVQENQENPTNRETGREGQGDFFAFAGFIIYHPHKVERQTLHCMRLTPNEEG